MKKHLVLGLPRLAIVCVALGTAACGDDSNSNNGSGTTTSATVTSTTAPSTVDTSTTTSTVDTGTLSSTTGAGGTNGTLTGTTGEVASCEILSLGLFSRSDTDAAWDDNDFSEVALQSGCPTLLDVTWPHEEDWEDGDPSEANYEETHFTLDSYGADGDLTGKQLNLTIELSDDVRGPDANAGAYLVSLVSVSTYEYDPEDTGTGGTDGDDGTGGVDGTGGGDTTDTGTGGTGGTVDGGLAGMAGAGGAPVLVTGYSEAETPREQRLVLRYVGDRATLVFPLPDKTEAIESYDPSTAIKVNVRIYNQSYDIEMPDDAMGGAGGSGGDTTVTATGTGTGTTSSTSSMSASASSSMSSASSMSASASGTTSSVSASTTGTTGTGGASSTDGGTPDAIFDYVTTQFAITHFSVTDRGVRP